jgi:hypothetical protein
MLLDMCKLLAAPLAGLGLVAGCASGGDAGDYVGDGVESGAGDASMAVDAAVAPGDGGAGHVDSGVGPVGDDGGTSVDDTGAGGSEGGSPDSGGGDSCTYTNACAAPTMMGMIAGDESGATLTASGSAAQWLAVDMLEEDSSALAVPMKITATLTSPAGANYDLYAYLGPSGTTTIECTTVKASSTNGAGQVDTVSFEWGETGTFANGVDDSAMVTLEVRYVSGPCTANDAWSLSLHGH